MIAKTPAEGPTVLRALPNKGPSSRSFITNQVWAQKTTLGPSMSTVRIWFINTVFHSLKNRHVMQGLLVLLSVNTYLQPAVYGVTNSNPKIGDKVEEVYAFIAQFVALPFKPKN